MTSAKILHRKNRAQRARLQRLIGAHRAPLQLLHQQHGPAALDFARDLTMKMRRHAGDAARKNLATLGDKFLQEIRVLVIDRLHGDIDSTPRHGTISAAKCRTAFWSFRLHTVYLVSRCSVRFRKNGLYFFFSKRFGVLGLFLLRVVM